MRRIWLSLALLLFAAVTAAADIARIDIVIASPNPTLEGLAESVRHELQLQFQDLTVVTRTNVEPDNAIAAHTLLINVGAQLLPWVYSEKNNYAATINFYVNSFDANSEKQNETKITSLYRDQPLARQLRLAKLLIPRLNKVALLYDRALPIPPAQLQRDFGINIQAISIYNEPDWAKNLSHAMESSDILLGLDDPAVYNSETIRSILLTTYRHNKVLIGPSRAFVNAGSLASCYSSPSEYLQQLSAMVKTRLQQGHLPRPQYPHTCHIAVNSQVAVSLNLSIPDEKNLSAWEQTQPGECDDGC